MPLDTTHRTEVLKHPVVEVDCSATSLVDPGGGLTERPVHVVVHAVLFGCLEDDSLEDSLPALVSFIGTGHDPGGGTGVLSGLAENGGVAEALTVHGEEPLPEGVLATEERTEAGLLHEVGGPLLGGVQVPSIILKDVNPPKAMIIIEDPLPLPGTDRPFVQSSKSVPHLVGVASSLAHSVTREERLGS